MFSLRLGTLDPAIDRFNYLPAPRPAFGARFAPIAVDNRVRGPLAALAIAIVFTIAASTVQIVRLHAAADEYARASMRLTADGPALREIAALQARLIRESDLSNYVDGVRRANLARANELAWIGNRLPAQTWLSTLRYENGSYSLEGTSDQPQSVAAAMDALRDPGHPITPQLVSLSDDPASGAQHVHYRLRIRTPE